MEAKMNATVVDFAHPDEFSKCWSSASPFNSSLSLLSAPSFELSSCSVTTSSTVPSSSNADVPSLSASASSSGVVSSCLELFASSIMNSADDCPSSVSISCSSAVDSTADVSSFKAEDSSSGPFGVVSSSPPVKIESLSPDSTTSSSFSISKLNERDDGIDINMDIDMETSLSIKSRCFLCSSALISSSSWRPHSLISMYCLVVLKR
mmetsp:Transcript_28164/g.60266  ORF Transcript_28164/g.60266 Transcript_28164/m.60266 type:complete len:207 (+) Transcript_28164:306-926(+)